MVVDRIGILEIKALIRSDLDDFTLTGFKYSCSSFPVYQHADTHKLSIIADFDVLAITQFKFKQLPIFFEFASLQFELKVGKPAGDLHPSALLVFKGCSHHQLTCLDVVV
jgi:hypothetical protein